MASMAANSCNVSVNTSSLVSPSLLVQEKASRNKRKYRADTPLTSVNGVIIPLPQNDSSVYEFSAEKFGSPPAQGQAQAQASSFDLAKVQREHNADDLKLDLGPPVPSEVGTVTSQPPMEEVADKDEVQEANWSDPEEAELEKLAMSNLDTIFKSAIKKLVSCGYSEEVALRAVLRLGLCYGSKDMVTNIVENTLAFLRSIQGMVDPTPRDHHHHHFGDLQQLEKYVLAEMVCVLREVRPFFSVGDAMWCLLICDMNISHACAVDGNSLSGVGGEGSSNKTCTSASNQSKGSEGSSGSEVSLVDGSAPIPAVPCSHRPRAGEKVSSSSSSQTSGGLDVDSKNLTLESVKKTFSSSHSHPADKSLSSKKVLSSINKREYLLRQKALHLEKHSRAHGCKGSSRAGKLSSLSASSVFEKKPKPVPDSNSISLKTASLKITKAVGVDLSQGNSTVISSVKAGPSTSASFNPETVGNVPELPKTSVGSPPVLPVLNAPPTFSGTNTDLSLSLTSTSNSKPVPVGSNSERCHGSSVGILYDKALGQFVPRDKKDEMILSLIPRVKELQHQLKGWNDWANQKVMQAASRLSIEKTELKILRQEKEEVERLKKEKQNLEESTMKKLSEMENALSKASGQVERANSAVWRLESENTALRQEMEVAKLHAAESAANFKEVLKREKKTLMKFQSWEKQKVSVQEELAGEKVKLGKLLKEVEQAKNNKNQVEARWRQEEKAKEDLLAQGALIRKEREESEVSAKSKEDMIKLDADNNLRRYKDDIQKLEKEISALRLKTDSSKIAALRRGIVDGTYASRVVDNKNSRAHKDSPPAAAAFAPVSELMADFKDSCCVKRERECVMCLSEETCVVFLPCAHQVVCKTCNELHEKQGMKDCPSCRSSIQRRITVRYAPS